MVGMVNDLIAALVEAGRHTSGNKSDTHCTGKKTVIGKAAAAERMLNRKGPRKEGRQEARTRGNYRDGVKRADNESGPLVPLDHKLVFYSLYSSGENSTGDCWQA